MKTEEYTDPQAFMAALKGKRTKRQAPGLPQSEPGLGNMLRALDRLAARGLQYRYRAGIGHDCWSYDGRSTPVCATYHEALRAAESSDI